MTFGEKAMLTVGVFTAVASWLALPGFRPAFDQANRVAAALVLALFAAVGVSFAVAMFEPERPQPPITSTAAAPPPAPTPVPVYAAPPEPAATATTATTSTMPAPVTATFAVPRPQPVPVEPIVTPARDERVRKAAAIEQERRDALAFMRDKQWPRAVEAWRGYIAAYGGHDRAADHTFYYNLGVSYDALRQWREAAEAFERARDLDDRRSDTQNLIHLGRCYGKLGRWKESVAAYEDVLEIQPSNAIAQKGLAWARQQQPPE
jgi:tetratricopeptide (TPR) repeat protein